MGKIVNLFMILKGKVNDEKIIFFILILKLKVISLLLYNNKL